MSSKIDKKLKYDEIGTCKVCNKSDKKEFFLKVPVSGDNKGFNWLYCAACFEKRHWKEQRVRRIIWRRRMRYVHEAFQIAAIIAVVVLYLLNPR